MSLKNIYVDGRATVRGWSAYKRQTGTWPWSSIAAHFLNWVAIISGMLFLAWCAGVKNWSKWQFAGILFFVALAYAIFWGWAKRRLKLNQIRRARRLRVMRNR